MVITSLVPSLYRFLNKANDAILLLLLFIMLDNYFAIVIRKSKHLCGNMFSPFILQMDELGGQQLTVGSLCVNDIDACRE